MYEAFLIAIGFISGILITAFVAEIKASDRARQRALLREIEKLIKSQERNEEHGSKGKGTRCIKG